MCECWNLHIVILYGFENNHVEALSMDELKEPCFVLVNMRYARSNQHKDCI